MGGRKNTVGGGGIKEWLEAAEKKGCADLGKICGGLGH